MKRLPTAALRRVPLWGWVAPLVLAAHLLLFWVLAGKPALPLAAPVRPPAGGLPPGSTPTDFTTRETLDRDPRTGEIVSGREFTVPTRLTVPPAPSPSARP